MLRKTAPRVALALSMLLLPLAGAAEEERLRGRPPALHWLLSLLPEPVRFWLGDAPETPAPPARATRAKCSGGIDPNGKPCP